MEKKLMLKNNNVAVIYFDDMQIVGRIATVSCGKAVTPLVTVRKDYSGIMDDVFTDREEFKNTFSAVLTEMVAEINRVPAVLYIGVPNQFCHVETQSSEIEFDRMTKINKHHIQTLWDDAQFNTEHREVIAKKALYYKLEEYEDVLLDAVGVATIGLSMVASVITVSNELRPLINSTAVTRLGFADFDFVCLADAELFMIPEKDRDAGCSLIRSDFFSTSVANIIGDGVTQLSHFNIGMGHLVSEIVDNFGLDYESARQLLLRATPTYEMLLEETYTANGDTIPAGIFNEFIAKRINEFGNRLSNFDTARVVYLSGGNYDQIYGISSVLGNICERRFYPCRDVLNGATNYPENTLNALIRFITTK